MVKIKCTSLNGKEFEISDDFRMHGLRSLWSAFVVAPPNTAYARMLEEAHAIASAVLYGTIEKEG